MVETDIIVHKPTDTRWKLRWYPNGTQQTDKDGWASMYIDLFRKPLRYESFKCEYELKCVETDDVFGYVFTAFRSFVFSESTGRWT